MLCSYERKKYAVPKEITGNEIAASETSRICREKNRRYS